MAKIILDVSLSGLELIFKRWIREVQEDISCQSKELNNEELTPEILTVKQAAEFLNLKVPTIYQKISKGELPHMKRGKRVYFSRKTLMEYLEAGRIKSRSEIEGEAEDKLVRRNKRRA